MRVPTSDLHAANACWSLFLLSTYLVVAEAASFDKKELCRSDTRSNNNTARDEREKFGRLKYAEQALKNLSAGKLPGINMPSKQTKVYFICRQSGGR